jgi:hypothetical protein
VRSPSYSGESIQLEFKTNVQGYTSFSHPIESTPTPRNLDSDDGMNLISVIVPCIVVIVVVILVALYFKRRYPASVPVQATPQESVRLLP